VNRILHALGTVEYMDPWEVISPPLPPVFMFAAPNPAAIRYPYVLDFSCKLNE
jgi:hypothetical protein